MKRRADRPPYFDTLSQNAGFEIYIGFAAGAIPPRLRVSARGILFLKRCNDIL